MKNVHKKRVVIDVLIIVASIIVAYALVRSSVLDVLILSKGDLYVLNSFVAGLFFTSAFTTAPAIAVLGKLGIAHSPYIVALFGGLGALIGDFIIFSFVKSHITEDIVYLLSYVKGKRLRQIFKHRFMRWSLAFVGALIIASPFPDEIGLALMGLSRISTTRFAIISFTFNAAGILMIAYIARAVSF